MAVIKRVLCPRRLRKVPSQFSWVDHRLVRDRHLCRCSHPALALYLFLVTVCDGQGLSYYSDASIMRLLKFDLPGLAHARQELIDARLIAHQRPLYQVLALEGAPRQVQPLVQPAASLSDPGVANPPGTQSTPQTRTFPQTFPQTSPQTSRTSRTSRTSPRTSPPEPGEPTRLDQILRRLIEGAS
jgi:hypothetical protein